MTKLTPISRFLLTFAIVGTLFFGVKSLFSSEKDASNETTVVGKPSNAPVLLSLSGSSTLGNKMMPEIAKQFMFNALHAQNVTIQKVNDLETNVVGEIDGNEQRITIRTQGSLEGINDLHLQKADLAMLSGGTDNLAADVQLDNIALDGIAVLVNPSNAVKELTKSQIRDIFLGKTTNWAQVGGQSAPINCYARQMQSGTFEAFKQLVMEQVYAALSPNIQYFDDSKQLTAAIESDPNGIGFSSFSAIGATKSLGLSDVGTTVQYPSVFTIETEDYLLTRRLYLAHLASNKNPFQRRFIEFCEADDKGQKVVADAGFVNMNLHNADMHATIANAPPQYLAVTNAAKRLPTTLHFQSGSKNPDVRATDDIKRIVNLLSEPNSRNKQVELIGFTDNVGNPTQNLALSTERAQAIQTEFAKFGIRTDIFGFGQALPIAANTNAMGQNKNRRVEVWIK